MKLPAPIQKQLQENFAIDVDALADSHEQPVPVSFRINPWKPVCHFKTDQRVPWTTSGFYVAERPDFTNDPLFHAGCYYVQEASSMFLEQAFLQCVDPSQPLRVLDACASPGGKSTLLASLLNENSLLVSNEVINTRVPALTHNMVKWAYPGSLVSTNDPQDFKRLSGFFDVLVVDAPCSGSGLFRKQADALDYWSEENVLHCSLRQQRILHDLMPALKENGVLIYSTCSYSMEENEAMCDYLCAHFSMESIRLQTQKEWGLLETFSEKELASGYRFFPHLSRGEGFFLACFRKKAALENRASRNPHKLFSKISGEESAAVNTFVSTEKLHLVNYYGEICGFQQEQLAAINELMSALKIKKLPRHIGQLKGKDFIPHPYLAYTSDLQEAVAKTGVNEEVALKYLRKLPFTLDQTEKGFTLLSYRGCGLGWMKNLGNRINNYYPADWRILKSG